MEQALGLCSAGPADEGRAKVQKYCRKIYELGYVPYLSAVCICTIFG